MSEVMMEQESEIIRHRHETSTLGMWVFLATEAMFFGGVIGAYLVYRGLYTDGFREASSKMNLILGTVNTAVLLTSSYSMALAVRAAGLGRKRAAVSFLCGTILLGIIFLAIKGTEYREHILHHFFPGAAFHFEGTNPLAAQLFFGFYFVMTGLHALHVLIGIIVLSVIAFKSWRGRFSGVYSTPVEITGLYWHLVDIIWIFLFPLLYLAGPR